MITSPIFGLPLMALLLASVFWLTIAGANVPSGMLASVLIDWAHPVLKSAALAVLPWWAAGLLVDGLARRHGAPDPIDCTRGTISGEPPPSMEVPPSLATSRVSDLVARCLELLESTGPEAVEALLAANREQAFDVRARLQQLSQLGLLAADGSAAQASALPERLGPFRLLEKLGAGGMGVVYLARDEVLGREVALKLVRPDLLLFGNARERFRREIEAIARLRHPAILPVYSAGEEGGVPFFVMEYVDGCSLSEVLTRRVSGVALSEGRVVSVE